MGQAADLGFSYLAFDYLAGGIIGHGRSAFHAAQDADRNEPGATIQIVYVGYVGAVIFEAGLSLPEVGAFMMRLPKADQSESELFRRAILANRRSEDAQKAMLPSS